MFQHSLTGKNGSSSGFGSWKTVPAVPVPLSVSGKTVPTVPVSVPVRFLSHPVLFLLARETININMLGRTGMPGDQHLSLPHKMLRKRAFITAVSSRKVNKSGDHSSRDIDSF